MAESFQINSTSELQTMELGAALARMLTPGNVLALEGSLGSGKTCFVRGLARGLGIDPSAVSSPTFIICQEYSSDSAHTLAHIDAYRLQGLDELESIGWAELLESDHVIIAIEWADRIRSAIPEDRCEIAFTHVGENTRSIVIHADEAIIEQLNGVSFSVARVRTDKCHTCGCEVNAISPAFPFCSERCKLADLGQWFNEKYKVTRPVQAEDEFEGP